LPSKSKKNSKGSSARKQPSRSGPASKPGIKSGIKSTARPIERGVDAAKRASAARAGKARKAGRKATGLRRAPGAGRVQTLGPIGAAGGSVDAGPQARKARETADSATAAIAAIDAALEKKALLPVLIDVSSLASYTDFIGIVSGRSDRQVDAIAEGILAVMKARGRSLLGQEGSGSGRWTLLDFGDVVIHVFYHPVREFYDLESLWVDAPRVPLKIPPEAVMAQPDALYGNL
jgi:ribosome-associated protein